MGGLNDYAPILGSIILGTSTIVVIFLITERLFNQRIALISSTLLAFDPLSIRFSRSALAQADSIFLLYLALLFYCLSLRRNKRQVYFLILSGIVMGIGYTCHYNIIWVIPVIILSELLILKYFRTLKAMLLPSILRCSMFIVSFASLLIVFNLPYALVSVLAHRYDPNLRSYFGELVYNFFTFQVTGFEQSTPALRNIFIGLSFFPALLIRNYTIAGLGVMIITLILAIKTLRETRAFSISLVLTLFWFPYLFWSLYPVKFERTFIALMPALIILVAVGLNEIYEFAWLNPKLRKLIPLILLLLFLIPAFIKDVQILQTEFSNFREGAIALAEYVEKNGGTVNSESFNFHTRPIWQFYLQEFVDEKGLSNADRWINFAGSGRPEIIVFDEFTPGNEIESFRLKTQQSLVPIISISPTPLFSRITIYRTSSQPR